MAASFYGGSLTQTGRLGRRPQEKSIFKLEVLLERLVRFDLAKAQGQSLLSDPDISRVLGKSVRAINSIRSTVPYLRKRMEITTGISTDADGQVQISISKHKQMLEMGIPDAMRVILDTVRRPIKSTTTLAESKFIVETARDLLDRQGSFPRISRTDAHLKVAHDFKETDGVSDEILRSLEGSVQEENPTETILQALAANKKFTHSETLSAVDMEKSLLELESASKEIQ